MSEADGSALHRGDQSWHADEGDRALCVVGEDVEAGFGSHVSEPSCLQVASAHPVFQRAEDMLDRSSSDAHGVGPAVEPGLHGIDHLSVVPSVHSSIVSRICALAGTASSGHGTAAPANKYVRIMGIFSTGDQRRCAALSRQLALALGSARGRPVFMPSKIDFESTCLKGI